MIIVLHLVALALYLGAAGIQIGSLVRGQRLVPRTGAALLVAAMVLHAAGLVAFVVRYQELPLVGLAPSLSTLAFLVAALLLVLATFGEARPVGIVLLPIVSALLVGALALQIRPAGRLLAFRGWWLAFHVVLGFIGYVGLAVAFAAGLLYLLQFRELKGKRFGRIFRFFPSLATLDRLGRMGLSIGFPSLTLNLLLGWAWTIRFQHSFAFAMPQVIWGIITWVVFLAAMVAGNRGATKARSMALASVVGFTLVVAAYVILRIAVTGGRLFL
jgi:ABC-type transport system involved in cytochrome c biogenesis permease subunit